MAEETGKKIKELELITTVGGKDDLIIDTTPTTGSPQTKRISVEKLKEEMTRELNSALGGLAIQVGRVSIIPKPNEPTTFHLKFPKPFKEQPVVNLTPVSGVPGEKVLGVGTLNNTSEGCDIILTRTESTETVVAWTAIGKAK